MTAALVFLALAVLVAAVAWRPHGWGPAIGAALAVAIALASGAAEPADLGTAVAAQWRAYVTLIAVMAMTAAAEQLGLLDRVAAWIEPHTRGPVRHAFRVTFVISTLVAAVLSNDAAILLMTPTVLALLRTVYPRRHPKFDAPFAIAVFASAGVAPLVISNPMNLIFAEHAGIGFNSYSATMVPVAIAGWIATYAVLAWLFRDVLADPAPALGAWPATPPPSGAAKVVMASVAIVLCAYPVVSFLGAPLWPVAAGGGAVAVLAAAAAGRGVVPIARAITWTIFPFLLGVFVLAIALDRIGVVAWLTELYAGSTHPIATIGVTSSIGSAVLNNHPMSVLNAFALARLDAPEAHALAALVGGDLGPRLLPVGSLAALLWFDLLRRHAVTVTMTTFLRVGVALTAVTLTVSLLVLALIARLG